MAFLAKLFGKKKENTPAPQVPVEEEGLTPEDLIAFPYGKNVRPGVRAEEGDINDLYG